MKRAAGSARSPLPRRVGIAAVAFFGILQLASPVPLRFVDDTLSDTVLRLRRQPAATGRVVMVDIDERSLRAIGQWPWPRYRLAALADRITAGKPAAVVFDMAFPEPDRVSLLALGRQLEADLGARLPLAGIPPQALDTDRAFAAALSRGPFVLGHQFLFEGEAPPDDGCRLHPATVIVRGEGAAERLFQAPAVLCSLPSLSEAATASGFLNVVADRDGILRRIPLLIRHRGSLYPGTALAAAMVAGGRRDVELVGGPFGIAELRLDDRRIPVDPAGNLVVNYRGPRGTIPRIPAADVLSGAASPTLFARRCVVVGTSATGLLDIRSTPVDPAQPGAEIQATAIDNLLAGDPLVRPPWGGAAELAATLLLATAGMLIGLAARPLAGSAAAAGACAGLLLAWAWLLADSRLLLRPALPAAACAGTFGILMIARVWLAEREVAARTKRLALTQDALIQSMAAMVETRHRGTGEHIQRTRRYVRLLANRLRSHPRFREALSDETIDLMHRLAPLHDIGKVGIPDRILLKGGQLDDAEREIMKRHTVFGAETIRLARGILGDDSFLGIAEDFALSHQERWDGTGYPRGLKGDDIPLAGRLMAVADSYDALRTARDYKPALSHETAVGIMREGRGTSFDPDVLDAFLEIGEEFRLASEGRVSGVLPPKGERRRLPRLRSSAP